VSKGCSVNVPGVGPGVELCDGAKLLEQSADNTLAVRVRTQLVELRHHSSECPLEFADRAFRVELALFVNAPLAFDELFAVKI
jgi:hypothetical protein